MMFASRASAALLLAAPALTSLLAAGCAAKVDTAGTGGGEAGSGGGGEAGTGGAAGAAGQGGQSGCFDADDCAMLTAGCQVGACINGECSTLDAPDGGSCDDGQYCTVGDVCVNGECMGGPPKFCPGAGDCSVGVCNEDADACESMPGNNGDPCDDGEPCTFGDTCSQGVCQPGGPTSCVLFDDFCKVGVCVPGQGCVQMDDDGGACDDGLFCTDNDLCSGGQCMGSPKVCAPATGCFVSVCDEQANSCTAVAGNDGSVCDDGNDCTTGTTCAAGACIGGQATNEGLACDDKTSCTSGEFCTAGVCGGGMGPVVYFSEDFSDNSAGWVLGPEWEIGPAEASTMAACSSADPATDHTPTADNGIAGVVIGGNAATNQHPAYWLESPPFDTSAAQGSVYFQFFRWLSSDYDPYMHNYVEVFDGTQWVELAVYDGPGCTADNAWTYISFDVTALKNAQMRVRFGFDIGSSGVYTIGSWNLDDVLVASGECP